MLLAVAGRRDAQLDARVARDASALASARAEARDRNAARDARLAARAVRVVDVSARATVAAQHRKVVKLRQLRRARIDHEILGRALAVVTARVRQSLEQADDIRAHAASLLVRCEASVKIAQRAA